MFKTAIIAGVGPGLGAALVKKSTLIYTDCQYGFKI